MKNAIAILMLALLVPGQPIWAQSSLVENPEAVTQIVATPAPVEPTVQDVLISVCESRGYGEDCAKTLLGMLWNESQNISTAIGDQGRARGYFQIWTKLHKIPVACAEDLVCSADWSLTYMEFHSYPKYVNYAVQCHNTCGAKNGYAARAARNAKLLWNKPLIVNQAAPIELPIEIAMN